MKNKNLSVCIYVNIVILMTKIQRSTHNKYNMKLTANFTMNGRVNW